MTWGAGAMLEATSRSARWSVGLVILFAAAWAVLEVALGSKLGGGVDLLQVVWCRYAVHVGLLLAVWGWRKPGVLWRTRRPVFQLARSLLMFVMPYAFILSLAAGASVDTVWAAFWISPLLILAFAFIGLRERIAPATWLLPIVGLAASFVILRPALPSSGAAWVFPLLMALSFSLYVVMTRSLRHETVQSNLFYTAFGVLLVLSPIMPWVWKPLSAHDALVLFGIGAVGLLALAALDRAMALAPVSASAPALHLQLVFVLLLGHHDRISLFSPDLILAALVIISLAAYLLFNAGSSAATAPRPAVVLADALEKDLP